MMMLYVDLADGTNLAGRSSAMTWDEVTGREWLFLEDPSITAITSTPTYNEHGHVEMVDGSWADPTTIRDPAKVKMTVQGSKFLAYNVDSMIISMDKIRSIRVMKRDEIEHYDAAVRVGRVADSPLELGTPIVNE